MYQELKCSGCGTLCADSQSFYHHQQACNSQMNQHRANWIQTGGLAGRQGYGHTGACNPGCTCDFAKTSQAIKEQEDLRTQSIIRKIDDLRDELRRQHGEILLKLIELIAKE